jgi:hypothetical protein
MQLSARILQAGLHDLTGWVLIAIGMALAVQALGFSRRRPGVAHILRSYRPAEWSARQFAHERVRPMDPDSQWRKLTSIAETGFVQAGSIADLHARAAQELEAVDDALVQLLADYAPGAALLDPPHEIAPAPAPVAEPLAA